MKCLTAFLLASLFSSALASDSKDKDKIKEGPLTVDEMQCKRLFKLNRAHDTVANATQMAELDRKRPDRAQKFRDTVATSGIEYQRMTNNHTLIQFCNIYNSHHKLIKDCRRIGKIDEVEKKLKNETAIKEAARRKGKNEDQIKKKWEGDLEVLKQMKGNDTLIKGCDRVKKEEAKKKKNDAASVRAAGAGTFALGMVLYAAAMLY